VEPLHLPVRLRPVGAGLLRCDPESLAGVSPGVGLVGGAVVGEHPLDCDTALGEPGNSSLQDADRGDRLLVGVDLCVGDAGVVIDDGVHECPTHQRVSGHRSWFVRCRCPVPVALLLPHEPPAAPVRDVAELRHIHVDHRAGSAVFVTPDRLPGNPIDVRELVDAAPHQDGVHRRCRQAELAADLHRPETPPPPRFHDLFHQVGRRLRRHSAWAAGSIRHPRSTLGPIPGSPFPGRDG